LSKRHEPLRPKLMQALRDIKVDGIYKRLLPTVSAC
jgi:hypothetical protein